MQRGKRSKLVEELAAGPDGLSVFAAHSVEEAVLLRQQTRRHAGESGEGDEAQKVREGHHAARSCELGMRGCGVVVPGKEPNTSLVTADGYKADLRLT